MNDYKNHEEHKDLLLEIFVLFVPLWLKQLLGSGIILSMHGRL